MTDRPVQATQRVYPVYDSAARRNPAFEELLALIRHKDLIVQLVARSVKTRYKRSFLGVAWTMLNPLLTMSVLTLVFSKLFRFPTERYALYVLSGLLLWNFFAQSSTAAMNDLLWSGGLMGRVHLPKAAFAVAAVGTGLINLVLSLIAYVLIAIALGTPPPVSIAVLPILVLAAALFTLGVGLALSSAAIYFPDVIPTYEVLLTAWLYLTPVIYPMELIPENLQGVLQLNPFFHLLASFRTALYEGIVPDVSTIGVAFAVASASLIVGWYLFTRRSREYAHLV